MFSLVSGIGLKPLVVSSQPWDRGSGTAIWGFVACIQILSWNDRFFPLKTKHSLLGITVLFSRVYIQSSCLASASDSSRSAFLPKSSRGFLFILFTYFFLNKAKMNLIYTSKLLAFSWPRHWIPSSLSNRISEKSMHALRIHAGPKFLGEHKIS